MCIILCHIKNKKIRKSFNKTRAIKYNFVLYKIHVNKNSTIIIIHATSATYALTSGAIKLEEPPSNCVPGSRQKTS